VHYYGIGHSRVPLISPQSGLFSSSCLEDVLRSPERFKAAHDAFHLARAAHRFFVDHKQAVAGKLLPRRPPSVYRDEATGLLRCFYREIIIRFKARVSASGRRKHLKDQGLEFVRRASFSRHTVIARDPRDIRRGDDLIRVANRLAKRDDEIVYAAPNFVSEYRRNAAPVIPLQQWHLDNTGIFPGQVPGQDVRAKDGWAIAMGNANIVVAVLDDGVDIDHPALTNHIWRNPDASSQDKFGRDYTCVTTDPGFYNPRPKTFNAPFSDPTQNDIHGTPCAGLIAADAPDARAFGVAVGCRILPVKIFSGSSLTPDETVANAIQYAAGIADILSCSWDCPSHPATQDAITSAAANGRNGKGCAIFCSAGNSGIDTVAFPADLAPSIAVGASTGDGSHAPYSNGGTEISLVAPSGDGLTNVFTCDVSAPNMGFNPGDNILGGADGLYTNAFSGTSASVPIAAGVAAVLLSAHPELTAAQVKTILQQSSDKIGDGYDATGHSDLFGYGKVNLAAALNAAK
jgi:hypothetical protein